MNHPCKTMCGEDNKRVITCRGMLKGEEPRGLGGGGLLWVGQHCLLATELPRRDIIGFSASPQIQIALSQSLLFFSSLSNMGYCILYQRLHLT